MPEFRDNFTRVDLRYALLREFSKDKPDEFKTKILEENSEGDWGFRREIYGSKKSGLIYSESRSGHNFKVEIEFYGLKGVEKAYWKYKTKHFKAEKKDVFEIHNPSSDFLRKFKKVFKKYLVTEPEFFKRNL